MTDDRRDVRSCAILDPILLESFSAVAETLNFSEAARRLRISQPTISQRIRRLEAATGHPLFERDTHRVALTGHGEAMVGYARRILAVSDEAAAYFSRDPVAGRVRFGAADDLALTHLPGILRDFRREHTRVTLELTIGQSSSLARQLDRGRLDLVYVRREPHLKDGRLVRRDRLVWGAHRSLALTGTDDVPLVTYQAPSNSRETALAALDRVGRRWSIACAARDITGILAGVRAGLGIAVFPEPMMPPDLIAVDEAANLPAAGSVDFALRENPRTAQEAVASLSRAIVRAAPGAG